MSVRVFFDILNQRGTPAFFTDTIANRPAFGYQGRVFISTDSAQIFEDTGSSWTLIADAGVGGGTLSSVCLNGNTTATGIVITAGGLSTNSITNTGNTAGSVLFAGASGLESQSNATFFWDNTNKRLGIGNASPGAPLDIHGTGTQVQLNGTGANNSYIVFQNAGVSKWRIGNTYNGAANTFDLYNNSLTSTALSFNSTTNAATFSGSLSSINLVLTPTATLFSTNNTIYNYSSNGYMYIQGGSTGLGLSASGSRNNIILVNETSNYIRFDTNSLERFRITDIGNVGIGTVSPLAFTSYTTTQVSGSVGGILFVESTAGSIIGQLLTDNGLTGGAAVILGARSNHPAVFTTNNTERMRILTTGELQFTNIFASPTTNNVIYNSGTNLVLQGGGGSLLLYGGGSRNNGIVIRESNNDIYFTTNNTGIKMTIASSGNVLIGTTTDSGYILDVNGTSRVQGIGTFVTRVNTNNSTDNALFSLSNNGTLNTVGFNPNASAYGYNLYQLPAGGTTYIYNGSGAATWGIPDPSGNTQMYWIKNAGTGVLVLNAWSGTTIITNTGTSVSSIAISIGQTVLIQQDGNIKSYQLQ